MTAKGKDPSNKKHKTHNPKHSVTAIQRRRERIAILVMVLLCIPILAIYFTFFANAFLSSDGGGFTLANFNFLVGEIQLSQYTVPAMGPAFGNSVVFTGAVTLTEVVIACLAGYALSRMDFRGKRVITFSLLALRLFPGMLLLIGVLYVLMYMKVVNTLLGVILVAIALRLPGSTFIIRNFFNGIPSDIENSALVDGCTRFTAFFEVILHMIKPGIASISLFAFMSAWSNYYAFTLRYNIAIHHFQETLRLKGAELTAKEVETLEHYIMEARFFVYMLPVLVFFFVSQKQLMKGNLGGGKGI